MVWLQKSFELRKIERWGDRQQIPTHFKTRIIRSRYAKNLNQSYTYNYLLLRLKNK